MAVDDVAAALREEGCAVVERFLDDREVAALKNELRPFREQTPLGRNDLEGFVTRRICALFAKVRGFDRLAIDPLLLGVLDQVRGEYQLSGPVGSTSARGRPRRGTASRRRRVPAAVAAPAGGPQHDVGARRVHGGERRHDDRSRQPPHHPDGEAGRPCRRACRSCSATTSSRPFLGYVDGRHPRRVLGGYER